MVKLLAIAALLLISRGLWAQTYGPIPGIEADSDYFVYYADFNDNIIAQSQYYNMLIISINGITPEEVQDIRNGFDDIQGTDDDVIVIGYISVGEAHSGTITGDGTGPCYWNGSQIVYTNFGKASFYLDDRDYNGIPDMNQTWNSYYVNAGDPNWWDYNQTTVDNILYVYGCDGLFLDTVETASPQSWGQPYYWTTPGMVSYIEHLKDTNPDKYIIMNRAFFFFHPSLETYVYADQVRQSINGIMFEGYYTNWDWENSQGFISPSFNSNMNTWAPLLNQQADLEDGFTVMALDYLNPAQPDYETLLNAQINAAEGDQGWIDAVSSVLLNEIRWDVYHHHLTDNNPPTWPGLVGVHAYERDGANLDIYWNAAVDQTPPLSYHLYMTDGDGVIDFDQAPSIADLIPEDGGLYDFMYTVQTDPEYQVNIALRASDGTAQQYLDPNRLVLSISPGSSSYGTTQIDGYFEDWAGAYQLDLVEPGIEEAGDGLYPACDLVDAWMQEDYQKYYVSFSTAGNIEGQYFYHVFFDSDNDPATGFHSNGSYMGIDLMVENGYLWRYTGTNGEWSWAAGGEVEYEIGMLDGMRVELAVEKSEFPVAQSMVAVIFNVNDLNEAVPDDFAPDNFMESSYSFPPDSPDCIAGDVNQDLDIDVLDIVMLVAYILDGIDLGECGFESADVSDDGALDVLDIVMIIDIILGD